MRYAVCIICQALDIICAASFAPHHSHVKEQSKAKQSRAEAEQKHNTTCNATRSTTRSTTHNATRSTTQDAKSRAEQTRKTQGAKRKLQSARHAKHNAKYNAQRETHNAQRTTQIARRKARNKNTLRVVHYVVCIVHRASSPARKKMTRRQSPRANFKIDFSKIDFSELFSFPQNQPRRLKQSARLNVQPRFIFVWHFFTIL